jgi:membrane protein implicated in regulation of membrane protease activity
MVHEGGGVVGDVKLAMLGLAAGRATWLPQGIVRMMPEVGWKLNVLGSTVVSVANVVQMFGFLRLRLSREDKANTYFL